MTRIPTAELLALKNAFAEIRAAIYMSDKDQALPALKALKMVEAEALASRALLEQAEAALEVTRDRLESVCHSEFDGVWTEEDFASQLAEATAALAALRQHREASQ